jgi:hypothetical protein
VLGATEDLRWLKLKCTRCGSRDVERQVTWGAPTVDE